MKLLLFICLLITLALTQTTSECVTKCISYCEPSGQNGRSYTDCTNYCNTRCEYTECEACHLDAMNQCVDPSQPCDVYQVNCIDTLKCPRTCDGFLEGSVDCGGLVYTRDTFAFCNLRECTPTCDLTLCADGSCQDSCPDPCEGYSSVQCDDGTVAYPDPTFNCMAECPSSCEVRYIECSDGTYILADSRTCEFYSSCPLACTDDLVKCPGSTVEVGRDPYNNCGPDLSRCPPPVCQKDVRCPDSTRYVLGDPADCTQPAPGLCDCPSFVECPNQPGVKVPVDLRTCLPYLEFCKVCDLPPYTCADGTLIERNQDCIPVRPCPVGDCDANCKSADGTVDTHCSRECICRESAQTPDGKFDDFYYRTCIIKLECEDSCLGKDGNCVSDCLCQYNLGACATPSTCRENCFDEKCVARCECNEACMFLDYRQTSPDGSTEVVSSTSCQDKCFCSKFPKEPQCSVQCEGADCNPDICALRHPNDPVRYKECWCQQNPGLCDPAVCVDPTGRPCVACDCPLDENYVACQFLCNCPRSSDECKKLAEQNLQYAEFSFSGTLGDCSQDTLDEFFKELDNAVRECSMDLTETKPDDGTDPRVKRALSQTTSDLDCHEKCTLVRETRRTDNNICYDNCYRTSTSDSCEKCDAVKEQNDLWLVDCHNQCNSDIPVPDCLQRCETDHVERNREIETCRKSCDGASDATICLESCERLQASNDLVYKACFENSCDQDPVDVPCYQTCELKLVPLFDRIKSCYANCPKRQVGGCGCESLEIEAREQLRRCYDSCSIDDTNRECLYCEDIWTSSESSTCLESCPADATKDQTQVYECQRTCSGDTDKLVTQCREECFGGIKDIVDQTCLDICRARPTYETCLSKCDPSTDCSTSCRAENDLTLTCFDRCYQQTDCVEGDTTPNCCRSRCAGDEECHRKCMSQYTGSGFTCTDGVFEASRQFSSVVVIGNTDFLQCVESRMQDAAERLDITTSALSVEILQDGSNVGGVVVVALLSLLVLLF